MLRILLSLILIGTVGAIGFTVATAELVKGDIAIIGSEDTPGSLPSTIAPPDDIRAAVFPGVVTISISRGFLCLDHSHGTGFILDAEGRIGTAKHVVASFGSICGWSVILNDGRSVSGKVLWKHPSLDVAEIKIDDILGARVLQKGSSSAVSAGDTVYTVSYPGGTSNPAVLSVGTLTGRGPCNEAQDGLLFDADVLPGYSGSPLLDSRGRVIGVVTGSLSAFKKGEGSCAVPIENLPY